MKNKILLNIPSVILLLVFIFQVYQVHFRDLVRWKGGGFGMFSSIDSGSSRFFRLFIKVDGKLKPAALPFNRGGIFQKALIYPSDQNLKEISNDLLQNTWISKRTPRGDHILMPMAQKMGFSSVLKGVKSFTTKKLCLEIWSTKINTHTVKLSSSFVKKYCKGA